MNKEEILEKSRMENKNKDLFEMELLREGRYIGSIVSVILATIFFVIQFLVGGGINYGLYAVIFAMIATVNIFKAIRMKKRFEIIIAVIQIIVVALLSFAHIYQLISLSTSL
jgi:predicted membrane-bound spermidine synthase